MDWATLIISLISGLAGGNIAGAFLKEKNLGPVVNSIAGLVGGGVGDFLMKAAGLLGSAAVVGGTTPELSQVDFSQVIGNIAGSGAGGAILTLIVSYLKSAFNKV